MQTRQSTLERSSVWRDRFTDFSFFKVAARASCTHSVRHYVECLPYHCSQSSRIKDELLAWAAEGLGWSRVYTAQQELISFLLKAGADCNLPPRDFSTTLQVGSYHETVFIKFLIDIWNTFTLLNSFATSEDARQTLKILYEFLETGANIKGIVLVGAGPNNLRLGGIENSFWKQISLDRKILARVDIIFKVHVRQFVNHAHALLVNYLNHDSDSRSDFPVRNFDHKAISDPIAMLVILNESHGALKAITRSDESQHIFNFPDLHLRSDTLFQDFNATQQTISFETISKVGKFESDVKTFEGRGVLDEGEAMEWLHSHNYDPGTVNTEQHPLSYNLYMHRSYRIDSARPFNWEIDWSFTPEYDIFLNILRQALPSTD